MEFLFPAVVCRQHTNVFFFSYRVGSVLHSRMTSLPTKYANLLFFFFVEISFSLDFSWWRCLLWNRHSVMRFECHSDMPDIPFFYVWERKKSDRKSEKILGEESRGSSVWMRDGREQMLSQLNLIYSSFYPLNVVGCRGNREGLISINTTSQREWFNWWQFIGLVFDDRMKLLHMTTIEYYVRNNIRDMLLAWK